MKITVITGSPRKNSTSNFLADEFIKGAQESGNEVFKFDSAHADIKNCIACDHCCMGTKDCIFKDDFTVLRENILTSEMVVFVTPMYYFGMSSTLKKIIDRFYSIDGKIRNGRKKCILISSQHASVDAVKDALNAHYMAILSWLGMKNEGILNAIGIESIEQLKTTDYPKQAYELGKSVV